MKRLSCLIIEDEQLLAEVIKDYISQVPFLHLKQIFNDGISALDYLEENVIDLIFIDINLPKLKGIDLIRMFPASAKYIITTAYHEYALEGYELDIIDYLLKPVEFNRFLAAVKKAASLHKLSTSHHHVQSSRTRNYFYVSMNKKRVKINYDEIVYIEGAKEYVKIHLVKNNWIITKLQLGQLFEMLNEDFVRIHRSYIASKNKISAYNQVEVKIGSISLPVGTNYKDSLQRLLEE